MFELNYLNGNVYIELALITLFSHAKRAKKSSDSFLCDVYRSEIIHVRVSPNIFLVNPLTPNIKEQILLSCSHTVLIIVLWRRY